MVASGIPLQVPGLSGMLTDQRSVQLEQLGLGVQINTWVSPATRALWCSYDIMFGAAKSQATGGILIKSA